MYEQVWAKGSISDKDFMLNNLPKEYDVILDGLKDHLTLGSNDALMIKTIGGKSNHRYGNIKNKNEEKKEKEKEKALGAYNQQFKGELLDMVHCRYTIGKLVLRVDCEG